MTRYRGPGVIIAQAWVRDKTRSEQVSARIWTVQGYANLVISKPSSLPATSPRKPWEGHRGGTAASRWGCPWAPAEGAIAAGLCL